MEGDPEKNIGTDPEKVQGEPTESEEWMLCLLGFFLFLFKKLHYLLVEILRGMLV
jgi:hypothetical protein